MLPGNRQSGVKVGSKEEATVKFDPKQGTVTATIQELATYSMFLAEALFEALAEKGVVSEQEIKDRVAALHEKTKIILRRPN